MILRRVELKHFRRHNRPVELTLDERMTIVHGPNEAGKSTLFQALEYAFFRRSGAGGSDIETLAPWDTSGLAPTVIVDFAHGGAEYRLKKSWGPNSGTQLATLDAAGQATPFMGADADDFVTAIFCGDPPGKGTFSGFQARHLGLAQLLFAAQGRIPILGDEKDLAFNANARARLSQAIGAAGQTEREAKVAQRIKKAYDATFKGDGQPRKTAPSPALAEKLRRLDEEIECRAAGIRDLEALAVALRDAEESSTLRGAEALAAQARVKEERPRFKDALKLKGALDSARAAHDAAAKAYADALERKRAIGETRELLGVEEDHERKLATALDESEAVLREATATRDAALLALNEATSEDTELAAWRRRYEEMNRAELLRAEREKLAWQQHNVAAYDGQIASKAEELGALPEIDDATISELERLIKQSRDLTTQLEAARTSVTFTPERTFPIRWKATGIEREQTAPAGEPAGFLGDGPIRLEIGGVGAIEVRGPVADLAAAQSKLSNVNQRIAAIAAAAGTADTGELRVARERAAVLRREIDDLKTARSERLRGSDPGAVASRIATIDAELAKVGTDDDREALSVRISEKEQTNEAKRKAARAEHDQSELLLSVARKRSDDDRTAYAELREQKLTPLRETLKRLIGNESEEQRAAGLSDAYKQDQSASFALADAVAAYAPYADLDDPEAALEEVEKQADTLGKLAQEAENDCKQLWARLEAKRDAAPGAALSTFEEERERVRRDLERAQTEQRALRRLYELVKAADDQRVAGYAAPVLARVGPWYERIFGRRLEGLQISEHHAMEHLQVDGVHHAIDVAELSFGAIDQLGLLIRLGYASLLTAPDRLGRMPVILDDPLVHADEVRRRRLLSVLRELAEQAQIVIFTCRPEDYAGANVPMIPVSGAELAAR